jgi:hypothetical protein
MANEEDFFKDLIHIYGKTVVDCYTGRESSTTAIKYY